MPGWKERVEKIIAGNDFAGGDGMFEQSLALVNERLDAEGLRGKVWSIMPYRCGRCGSIYYCELEVGVEGPQSWRDDLTYIATPFGGERCSRCGGETNHVFKDVVFDALREPGTTFDALGGLPTHASRFFRVPREMVRYPTKGCDDEGNVIYGAAHQAFLSMPMHAIRRATGQ